MTTRFWVVIAACGLPGCADPAPINKSASYDAEMKAYITCNMVAARRAAPQQGDPLSLGVAARGACGREDADLMQALMRQHRPTLAMQIMDRFRASQLESNASTVVAARAGGR